MRHIVAIVGLACVVATTAQAAPRRPVTPAVVCSDLGCFSKPMAKGTVFKQSSTASTRHAPGRSTALVERARAYIGRTGPSLGLPARLWCADFMNMITGGGTGSRQAKSYLAKPRVPPSVGAIAVIGRRGGGHVGVVSGFTDAGDPIIISGNHGRKVGEGVYARSRVIAYVSL